MLASYGRGLRTHLAAPQNMSDIRFQSIEDGDLADIWYALGGSAARHPDHFQKLMDDCFHELLERREANLKPWLEERFRPFRLADSREDAAVNLAISPEARPGAPTLG
jgi:hypothetical protein